MIETAPPTRVFDPVEKSCCESPRLIETSNGEFTCSNCGLVHERIYDDSPSRAFDQFEREDRWYHEVLKITSTRYFNPRSTKITSPEARAFFCRVQKYNSYAWRDDKRAQAIYSMQTLNRGKSLDLPLFIIKTAQKFIKKVQGEKIMRGRSVHDCIEVCLLLACRVFQNYTFTIHDMDKMYSGTPSALIDVIRKTLHLPVQRRSIIPLIIRYGNVLGLDVNHVNEAIRLARKARPKPGRSHRGYVAGLYYVLGTIIGPRFTQEEIATKLSVTEVTIRSRVKEINGQLDKSRKQKKNKK